MLSYLRLPVLAMLVGLLFSADSLEAGKRSYQDTLNQRITDAEDFVRRMTETPDKAISRDVLAKSYGVIVMRQFKGAFIFGMKGGNGVALLRNRDTNEWSAPGFVRTFQTSIGFQAGAQSAETILVIMNKKGIEMLSKSKYKIGVNGAIVAGPYGREGDVGVGPNVVFVSYSRAAGLFGGIDLEGGYLGRDSRANQEFYGRDTHINDVFAGRVQMPALANGLRQRLTDYAAGH